MAVGDPGNDSRCDLLWVVARSVPHGESLLRGWVAMLGLILHLHFGTLQIVALLWQSVGINAKALMSDATAFHNPWGVLGKALEPRFPPAFS
jgi:hypothetical protein